jgi:hypothetical protein
VSLSSPTENYFVVITIAIKRLVSRLKLIVIFVDSGVSQESSIVMYVYKQVSSIVMYAYKQVPLLCTLISKFHCYVRL